MLINLPRYMEELAGQHPPQLLLNVDGVAGSGKTFALLKTCARLQELAGTVNKQYVTSFSYVLLPKPQNPVNKRSDFLIILFFYNQKWISKHASTEKPRISRKTGLLTQL
jgi:hypothetical protein